MLPEAHVSHQTARRLRIKVPSRRGDERYFESLRELFSALAGIERVEANPLTGSLLLVHSTDVDAIAEHALANDLFRLLGPPGQLPLARKIRAAYHRLNERVENFSRGELDIPSLSVLALLGLGASEIARGRLVTPAWYLAFWYALAILWRAPPGEGHREA
jgi:hypothetical protein